MSHAQEKSGGWGEMRRKRKFERETPVSQLARKATEDRVFKELLYSYRQGQPGVHLEIYSDDFRAFVTVENRKDPEYGYPDSNENPTRISCLSISKNPYTNSYKRLGEWFPQELVRKARHRFEKQAEKDSKLKIFLANILKYFG